MNESKCLQPVVAKYQKMTSDLTIDRMSPCGTNQADGDGNAAPRRPAVQRDGRDGGGGLPQRAVREEEGAGWSTTNSVDYRSSSKKYCDGCFVLSQFKFYTAVKKYPKHYLIRKWVGNEETEQIYTNANGSDAIRFPYSRLPRTATCPFNCDRHRRGNVGFVGR